MAGKRRIMNIFAAGLSLAPGFVFPFVLAMQLSTASSDMFLLASSVIVTMASVVGSAIEVNTVVQMGRVLSQYKEISDEQRKRYRSRQLLFAVCVTITLGALLTFVYGARVLGEDRSTFFVVASVCMMVPILGSAASVRSGELIARGNSIAPVLLQSFRTVPPLCVVLIFPMVNLVTVASALCLGEVLRVIFLELILRRLPKISEDYDSNPLAYAGTGIQALSSSSTQAGPVTDRFLLGPVSGSITAYEIADKIFYACFQFINMSMVVTRLSKWSSVRSMGPDEAGRLLRRDLRILCFACMSAAGVGLGLLYWTMEAKIVPAAWIEGVKWACIGLLAFPFAVGTFVASRFLVIAGKQRLMLRLSVAVTLSNIVINLILFSMFGPIGIPIGTALVRIFAFTVYLLFCLKVVPAIFGSDMEDTRETTA